MKGFGFPAHSVLNDQVGMYLNQKTKEESLDPEWVKAHAVEVYHPGDKR
ncbi:MAG: hypothetical protein IPP17_18450 [Bacteroidetes bacterium]|nr:hypothetical protein [Bacteroidota bacterium]